MCQSPRWVALLGAAALGFGFVATADGQPVALPLCDLVVDDLQFAVVQQTTWGQGSPCQVFNVTITVKNTSPTPAPAFKVRLERKRNGAWQEGCMTCVLAVPALGGGQSLTLDPRQFNNCSSDASLNWFRATADSDGQVREGNENNNSLEKEFRVFLPRQPLRRPRS